MSGQRLRFLGVSGSLRRDSTNSKLLRTVATLSAPDLDWDLTAGTGQLPHYDPDLDLGVDPDRLPRTVTAWRASCARADAIVFACPEYGHGVPGALKNALDWLVSSGELSAKPVAVTNAYPDRCRGRRALAVLVQSLRAMDARVLAYESGTMREHLVADLLRELQAAALGGRKMDTR